MFELMFLAIAVAICFFLFRSHQRTQARRKSLHQKNDGSWAWVEADGTKKSSQICPYEPGGAWATDSWSSGGFDGGDSGGGGD